MARKRFGLQFNGWEEMLAKLDEIGGSDAMPNAVEEALVASKEYVNVKIEKAIRTQNLPKHGAFETGITKQSIDREMRVEWQGKTAVIKVGFDFKKSGLTSIMLMYGTPKMNPVKGLKSAIYGAATKKEVGKIQMEALENEIARVMGG